MPSELEIRYVASNFRRLIHIDGAFGGLTAHGQIHMVVYADRIDHPAASTISIDAADRTGKENIPGRQGWTREIEADLVMSRDVARAIRDWLDQRLQILDDPDASFQIQSKLE